LGYIAKCSKKFINLKEYIELNQAEAIISKIDKRHQKIYFNLEIANLVQDDIEEIEYDDRENHKLYINIEEHKDNLVNDINKIQKQDSDFFKLYDFSEKDTNEIIDIVFSEILLEDMEQSIFFSNVSLSDNELKIIIRIDRENRLLESIPKDKTILLQGYLKSDNNPILTINRLMYQSSYPKKKFEIKRDTTIYFRSEDIYEKERDRNILTQDFILKLPMLSKRAKEQLKDWEDFLSWQKEYVYKNLIGFKYLTYYLDKENEKIRVLK